LQNGKLEHLTELIGLLDADLNRPDLFYRAALRKLMDYMEAELGCLAVFSVGGKRMTVTCDPLVRVSESCGKMTWLDELMAGGFDLWSYLKENPAPLIVSDETPQPGLSLMNSARVHNLMLVPKVKEGVLVAVVVLANAPELFVEEDVIRMQTLLSAIWHLGEEQRMLAEMKRLHDDYHDLFGHMVEGVAYCELVTLGEAEAVDYRFLKVNEAFFQHMGLQPMEMEGRLASEVFPEGQVLFLEQFASVARTGKPQSFQQILPWKTITLQLSVFSPQKGRFAMILFDRSEEVLAQKRLEMETQRLNTMVQSIGDGFISTDNVGRIVEINHVALDLTGWIYGKAVGAYADDVFYLLDETKAMTRLYPVQEVLSSHVRQEGRGYRILRNQSGQQYDVDYTVTPMHDAQGELLGAVLVFRDVGEQRKRIREIEYLSFHDALTGLYNRAFFQKELSRLDVKRQWPLSVIMGDVNGLKLTNDVFGHQHGDELLKQIATMLKEQCRKEDILARWGGDEFILLLPQTPREMAEEIANRMMECSREHTYMDMELSLSVGVATKTLERQSVEEVISLAEERMYRRKLLDKKSMRSTVLTSLLKTLNQKSNETYNHCHRLETLSLAVGKALGLDRASLDDVVLTAQLHDIGMVVVPEYILSKSGELDKEERKIMQQHPEAGYRICQSISEVAHVARYVLAHHERTDGKEYPYQLASEEIPLVSRIMAVVDAYDVMTKGRRYQPPKTHQEAIDELQALRGQAYDSMVVDAFLRLFPTEDSLPLSFYDEDMA